MSDPVTLSVCVTCRAGLPEEEGVPRPGARLYNTLEKAPLPAGVRLRPVECLSTCSKGCALTLSGGPQRWTYVYGNLGTENVSEILEGAARYGATADGLVPWRERPTAFRKNSIARIPPAEDLQ